VQIGAERFRAPEILFNPEIIGLEYPGVHQIVVEAIHRTDMDLRKALYGNIVLSGGSTLTKGFGNRLLHEVQRLAVKDMRIKILAPPERIYTTWTGGSILAGLSTFKKVNKFRRAGAVGQANMRYRCGWRRTSGRRTQTSFIPNSPSTALWFRAVCSPQPPCRLRKRRTCPVHDAWRLQGRFSHRIVILSAGTKEHQRGPCAPGTVDRRVSRMAMAGVLP
jgi:hypothetical protein